MTAVTLVEHAHARPPRQTAERANPDRIPGTAQWTRNKKDVGKPSAY